MKSDIKEFITINSRWLIIGGITLVVLTGGVIFYRKQRQKSTKTKVIDGSISTSRQGFKCQRTSYPLSQGTCHKDVKILQEYLLNQGHHLGTTGAYGNGVDGQFGGKTQQAASKALGKSSFTQTDIKRLKQTL